MRSRQDGGPVAHPTVDHSSAVFARVHVQLLRVASQDLDSFIGIFPRVDKDAAPIVVRAKALRYDHLLRTERRTGDRQLGGAGTRLTVIYKAPKGPAATGPRKERELAITDHLQCLVTDLELAVASAVVAAGAEPEVGPTPTDVLFDATVSGTVQGATVSEICTAGEDQKGAGGGPRLVEELVGCNGDDGVVGG